MSAAKSLDELMLALDEDELACLKYLSAVAAPLVDDKGAAALVAAIEVLAHPDWVPLIAVAVDQGATRVGAGVWDADKRTQEDGGE